MLNHNPAETLPAINHPAHTMLNDATEASNLNPSPDVQADAAAQDSTEPTPEAVTDDGHANEDDARLRSLAALSLIEYDRQRDEAAKQLGIRASTLDKLVADARKPVPHRETEPDDAPAVEGTLLGDAINAAQVPAADDSMPKNFKLKRNGLYYLEDGEDDKWICSPLSVTALTRDADNESWGRLLEWPDRDGVTHQWSIPLEMTVGDGIEFCRRLVSGGLELSPAPRSRELLTVYIVSARPTQKARCTEKTGWQCGCFVLPHHTFGAPHGEAVVYQSSAKANPYRSKGQLDAWRTQVAALCRGNSRLMFAAAAAFAPPLLEIVNQESGGLHFRGDSSSGKTSALRVAASVYGGKAYVYRWKGTGNGIEAMAVQHSDTLLVLDEIAQVDPKEAGEIAYMLANEGGKRRADRRGGMREAHTWRLLFLSSGEIGLAEHMLDGGKKIRAGQEVRLVEIPADAGQGFGVFENLHGQVGGAEFSNHIAEVTLENYGVAFPAFIEKLLHDIEHLPDLWRKARAGFIQDVVPANASGQVQRVAERFALVAMAGEMASAYGVTGWAVGEARQAAITCFRAWLDRRGGAGNKERDAILSQVRGFFEAHGASRFDEMEARDAPRIINRVGFKRLLPDGVEYFVLPEQFKAELAKGYDPKQVIAVLIQEGLLAPDKAGNPKANHRLPEFGQTRCYHIVLKEGAQ